MSLTKTERCLFLSIIFLVVFLVGMTLNYLAVTNNGCQMPVKDDGTITNWDSDHFPFYYYSEVNYPIFSDIFYIFNYVVSLGDMFMILGALGSLVPLFILLYLKSRKPSEQYNIQLHSEI